MITKLGVLLLFMGLSACAKILQPQVAEEQDVIQLGLEKHGLMAWYAVRFSILWEKETEPQWYMGTLIAGEVISPLLEQSRQQVVYWRVHRRAVHDKTGHVFSFIFYSSQADAALIYQHFKNNKVLTKLQQQQLLSGVSYDALYNNSQTNIADTSDPLWPEKIRSSWPFFIMGASQMWLEQIRAFKKQTLNESDIKQRYIIIQNNLTDLWQQQGQHALMHHLNALYAYQPVLVRF
ncbi:MAG: hypothetical protein GQ583_00085 [Methyloprofundus sp.]|nr:hypothetical protein [Methyloprofundus sp.]